MRKIFVLLIVLCGVMMTGCTQLIDTTDQESDMLAEYMAGTALRYDKNYKEALIIPDSTESKETIENTDDRQTSDANTLDSKDSNNKNPSVSPTSSAQADKSKNNSSVSLNNLYQEVGKEKFDVSYSGYHLYDSYPGDNDYFTIEAAKGKKLLAVTFTIKNTQKSIQKLSLIDKKLDYLLGDGKASGIRPMMTLLTNDIQYIDTTIKEGGNQKAVIIFEVDKDLDISKTNLQINYKDKTTVVKLSQ